MRRRRRANERSALCVCRRRAGLLCACSHSSRPGIRAARSTRLAFVWRAMLIRRFHWPPNSLVAASAAPDKEPAGEQDKRAGEPRGREREREGGGERSRTQSDRPRAACLCCCLCCCCCCCCSSDDDGGGGGESTRFVWTSADFTQSERPRDSQHSAVCARAANTNTSRIAREATAQATGARSLAH